MLNNIAVEKRIALSLYPLSWLERFSLLRSLPSFIRIKVKVELNQLKQMNVTNVDKLLSAIDVNKKNSALLDSGKARVDIAKLGFSEVFGEILIGRPNNRAVMLSQAIDEALIELVGSGE